MKLITIIYKSGVVVELTCESYRYLRRGYAHEHEGIEFVNPNPIPSTLGADHIAAIWEGRIQGAHDR